jgi:hypothetical protein
LVLTGAWHASANPVLGSVVAQEGQEGAHGHRGRADGVDWRSAAWSVCSGAARTTNGDRESGMYMCV